MAASSDPPKTSNGAQLDDGATARAEVPALAPLAGEPDPDGADCVACGRCCHHPPRTVTLDEHDEARMGEPALARWTELLDRPPYFRFLLHREGHCGALGRDAQGGFPCMIYESRPTGCRTVEPGSPCCLEARALGRLGKSVEFRRVRDGASVGED